MKMITPISSGNVTIEVPDDTKKIGLKISGGADSAILAYMLAIFKRDYMPGLEINTITSISSANPFQDEFATKVLEKVTELTGVKFNERHVNNVNTEYYIDEQISFVERLFSQKVFDMVFVGITQNPPSDAFETNHTWPPGRTGTNLPETEGFARFPFRNTDKKGIAELYQYYNVMDELFPITRSCEQQPATDFSKHCEECWFCHERYWGFGRYV